jgi:hypothetical protein
MMPTLFSRLGEVGNFVGGESVGLQNSLGEEKKNRFIVGIGVPLSLFDAADQFGSSFGSNHIGGEMIRPMSTGLFQRGLPIGGTLIRKTVDEIEIEMGNASLPGDGYGGSDGGAVMSTSEPRKIGRAKSLNPETEASDACIAKEGGFCETKAVGISFDRPFFGLAPWGDFQ